MLSSSKCISFKYLMWKIDHISLFFTCVSDLFKFYLGRKIFIDWKLLIVIIIKVLNFRVKLNFIKSKWGLKITLTQSLGLWTIPCTRVCQFCNEPIKFLHIKNCCSNLEILKILFTRSSFCIPNKISLLVSLFLSFFLAIQKNSISQEKLPFYYCTYNE